MQIKLSHIIAGLALVSVTVSPLSAQARPQNRLPQTIARESNTVQPRVQLQQKINSLLERLLTKEQLQEFNRAVESGKTPREAFRQLELSSEQKQDLRRMRKASRRRLQNQRQAATQDSQTGRRQPTGHNLILLPEEQGRNGNVVEQPTFDLGSGLLDMAGLALQLVPSFMNSQQQQQYQQVFPFFGSSTNAFSSPSLIEDGEVQWFSVLDFALSQAPNFMNSEQQQQYQQYAPWVEFGLAMLSGFGLFG